MSIKFHKLVPLYNLFFKIMKIGYARMSDNDQDVMIQLEALKKSGCEKIYKDSTGSFEDRPELNLMFGQINEGDVVVVYKLDRIAKSLNELNQLLKDFKKRDIRLISIKEKLDTRRVENGSIVKIVSVITDFQREINSEKIISSLEIAKKRGKKGGRPKGLSGSAILKAKKAKQLYEDDSIKVKDIASQLNIGKTTLYRYLNYNDEKLAAIGEYRNQSSNKMAYKDNIKDELIEKLFASKAFWSYSNVKTEDISDDLLIQKVMENLDIPDIKKLFSLYKKNHIRSVWKKELVLQDPYYRSLNLMLAKLFFNIKDPESYIMRVQREHLNSVA